MREAAGGIQPLDEHLERHVLVLVRRQAPPADLCEEVDERGVAAGELAQVDAQHQGVYEEADHIVECGIAPAGDRKAHRHIGSRADSGQQCGERRLDHHEAGRVVLTRDAADLLLQGDRPLHGDPGAVVVGRRRIWSVGGQVEALRQAGQRVLPEVELRGDGPVGVVDVAELRTLPQRVVDVLHRQRRPVGSPARAPAGISQPEITHQRGDRRAVGRDVVHHDDQDVVVVGDTEELGVERDLRRQVERVPGCRTHGVIHPVRGPAGGVDGLPPDVGAVRGNDHLLGCALGCHEQGPQAFVPGHHVGQRPAQCVGVEATAQPQRHGQVVDGRRPLQLVEEPQPVLGEGQREDLRPLPRHQRSQARRVTADSRGQLCHGRRLEERTHRKIHCQA
ncbi:Uncharacterised protein [Mycobacteroides abscessus subsp. abscessus]|nr:Uncharacterised protein [Mycobacteroides abscessus subsp. abscessus]